MGKLSNAFKKFGLTQRKEIGGGPKVKAKKVLSHQDVFVLKAKVQAATRHTTVEQWKAQFRSMDKKGRGMLSFDEFRRAVRRANVKVNVISDEELQDIVLVVDTDGSGQIDIDEYLHFLKPDDIPDVIAKASSWTDQYWNPEVPMKGSARGPSNAINGQGVSLTNDGFAVHTGDADGNVWNTRPFATKEESFISFEFPDVYFVNHIHLWNYMTWDRKVQKQDSKCALLSFDVSYSLNGTRWFKMGSVKGLQEGSPFGIPTYFGESIVAPDYGGVEKLPYRHQKAMIVTAHDLFGPPAKFLKFHNFENNGSRDLGNAYGINGVYFYGRAAAGDCSLRNLQMNRVPWDMHQQFQFVVRLNLSHNRLSALPEEMERMVLIQHLDLSYNHLKHFPKVLNEGDFNSTITFLDMSHNLFTHMSSDVAKLSGLRTLLLAGHYWDEDGLPDQLSNLLHLKKLDLRGTPNIHSWLWDEEARERHGLPPTLRSDRSIVTESEFIAYIKEHPLLITSLSEAGAKGMFYRAATEDKKRNGRAAGGEGGSKGDVAITTGAANRLDASLLEIFSKPFCGLGEAVYEMDGLEEILLERGGVDIYRPPGDLPSLPAPAIVSVIHNPRSLGVVSLFEDQAEQFPSVIHVDIPNICKPSEFTETKQILEKRGMFMDPPVYFDATATDHEMTTALRLESDRLSHHTNPPLPTQAPAAYRDTGAAGWRRIQNPKTQDDMITYIQTGQDALATLRPQYTFAPTHWQQGRPAEQRSAADVETPVFRAASSSDQIVNRTPGSN